MTLTWKVLWCHSCAFISSSRSFQHHLKATWSIEQGQELFSDGAIVCFFIWLFGLVDLGLVILCLASLGSCWGWSSVVLVAVLMLLWGVWWCLFLVICVFLFCFYPSLSFPPSLSCCSVPVFLWVCAWCLSQLPSSSISPFSTPPTPSPANGPPSPKFGRDPLSYCLKEINKTVKPRISSFRTLKRTVSVIGQGSSKLNKPVCCCFWHVSLRRSAALIWVWVVVTCTWMVTMK